MEHKNMFETTKQLIYRNIPEVDMTNVYKLTITYPSSYSVFIFGHNFSSTQIFVGEIPRFKKE